MVKQLSSEELALFRDGEDRIFGEIHKAYNEDIFLKSFRILKDGSKADAVVSETFEALWQNREKIRDSQHIYAYLIRVSRNKSINLSKAEKREKEYTKPFSLDDLENIPADDIYAIEGGVRKDLLAKLIDRLPEGKKNACRLYFLEKKTLIEIAGIMGNSPKTVRNQVNEGLKRIISLLGRNKRRLFISILLQFWKFF